jgi:hypothetical protein
MPEHPWAQTFRTLLERLAKVRIVLNRLADVLRQKKKPLGIALSVCLGLGLIFGVYAYFFWPYPKPPAKTAIGVKFRSADNQKIIELIDDKVCDLSAGEDSARLPYRVYFFDFRNLLSMMLGPMVEKQIWIMRTQEGLLDPDSTTLYANDSPEMRLVQSVKSIGQEVASYYTQHKSYPQKVDFTYRNPFTKKIDKPHMQQLTLHGPHEIKVLYAKLLAGLPWPDEPTLYPGSINCCAVTIKTSANDVDIFVIQVADAHGFPLSGSTDTSGYFYALEGGKEADLPLQPSLPQHGVQRARRQVVWLVEEPLNRAAIDILKHGASYLCCSLAMFLFAFYKIFRPTGIIKYASIAAMIFATIGFLLYGFMDYLPL